MPIFKTEATHANFGGRLLKLSHQSSTTSTPMALSLFLPPLPASEKAPVIFYLSGLTCTNLNCVEKGFLQRHAARHGLAIVYPDTSPRGANIPGEGDDWAFGLGAGYYLTATKEPWKKNYNMYEYVTRELPEKLWEEFGDKLDRSRVSVMGHSMGGHGAIVAVCFSHPFRVKKMLKDMSEGAEEPGDV
jgi:S-formylglutathione hydrolase